jgi:hypothetical protein
MRWLLMLPVVLGPMAAFGQLQPDFEAALLYDDNVPRAQLASDIVHDVAVAARAGVGLSFPAGERGEFGLAADARALRYSRYEGASVFSLGATASYRRKLGLGLTAPRSGAEVSAAWEDSPEPVRVGHRFGAAAFVGKRFGERLEASLTFAYDNREQRESTSVVPGIPGDPFSLQSRTLTARASYAFGERATLIASAAGRNGDVVSSTRRNPQIFAQSAAIAPDPAFGPDYIAYRLTGTTSASFTAGISYELSRRASLEAMLATDATKARGGLDYDRQVFTVSWAYRP